MVIPEFIHNSILFKEEVLNTLHIYGGSVLDSFMVGVTFTGNELFYMVILPVIYWLGFRKEAVKIGIVFLVSSGINDFFKSFFQSPRPVPSLLDERFSQLTEKYIPHSYGFPSGHTQVSVAFWWSMAKYFNKRFLWALSLFFVLVIPYSRLYLGVHHLGDVVGGYLIALITVPLLFYAIKKLEKDILQVHSLVIITALLIIPLALYFLLSGHVLSIILGTLSGFLIGAWWDFKKSGALSLQGHYFTRMVVIVIGFVGLFGIKIIVKKVLPEVGISDFIRYWFIGFWITFIVPIIARKIFEIVDKQEDLK
jgi:membrane-associated phospholipid phosphatase